MTWRTRSRSRGGRAGEADWPPGRQRRRVTPSESRRARAPRQPRWRECKSPVLADTRMSPKRYGGRRALIVADRTRMVLETVDPPKDAPVTAWPGALSRGSEHDGKASLDGSVCPLSEAGPRREAATPRVQMSARVVAGHDIHAGAVGGTLFGEQIHQGEVSDGIPCGHLYRRTGQGRAHCR